MDKKRKLFLTLIIVFSSILVIVAGLLIYFMSTKNDNTSNKEKTNAKNNIEINQNLNNNENEADIEEEANEVAMETFNAIFELYAGTAESISNVKALIATIDTSNSTRTDEHIVVLDNNGITEDDELDNNALYDISLSYDDEGYVSVIKINKSGTSTENAEDDINILLFNSKFTPYIGEINGKQLQKLIELVIEVNNTNPEHQLIFTSNNLQNLDDVKDENIYEIMFSYDVNGYINSINVDITGVEVNGEINYFDASENVGDVEIEDEVENI